MKMMVLIILLQQADIATSADGAEGVYVADIDGDGDFDFVSACYE